MCIPLYPRARAFFCACVVHSEARGSVSFAGARTRGPVCSFLLPLLFFVYFISFFSVTAVDGPVMIFARFRRVLVLFFLSFISRRQMPLPTPCPCFDFLWDGLSAELPRTPRYLDSRLDGGGLILVLPLDIWAF